jgi:hypothetical protein
MLGFSMNATCGSADTVDYPQRISLPDGEVSIQEPVISDWKRFRQLIGKFPVEVTLQGQESPLRGEALFEADSIVHFKGRRVVLDNLRVTSMQAKGGKPAADVEILIRTAVADVSRDIGLDQILKSLPPDFRIPFEARARPQLNFDPPRIVVSRHPTRLMLIDGPPAMAPIFSTQLEFVVNTDWNVFHDRQSGSWFVLDDGHWLKSNMLTSGDWISTTELPRDFLTLQVSSDWPQVGAAMPASEPQSPPFPITISYEPTELVLIDGEMQLITIADTQLKYVANTKSNMFLLDDRYYLLFSGRWFSTRDVQRNWYAVKKLPAVFADIPEQHPRASVLAAVPGTGAARLAMIESAIPRVAIVSLDAGNALEIPYVGEPSFVEIQGTGLRRAENTPFQVIMNNNFYYLCHEGAWYSSRDPQGPWAVASEVPEAIYTIPPTDPAYNVTYVKVDSFDDSSGQAAYTSTSGYYSRYYTGSTMVYGTGWYYPGYHNRSVYWRYPYTYGYGYGAWGPYWPRSYHYTADFPVDVAEKDWEWNLDGSKRRVYNYGPKNYIGSG